MTLIVEFASVDHCLLASRRLTAVPADFSVFDATDCIIDLDEVTVIQPIGKGAFGTVDLGVYKGEQVAVKKQVVKTAGLDKYLQSELTVLKNVTGHPNLMRFIGAGWRAAENAADARWIEVRGL